MACGRVGVGGVGREGCGRSTSCGSPRDHRTGVGAGTEVGVGTGVGAASRNRSESATATMELPSRTNDATACRQNPCMTATPTRARRVQRLWERALASSRANVRPTWVVVSGVRAHRTTTRLRVACEAGTRRRPRAALRRRRACACVRAGSLSARVIRGRVGVGQIAHSEGLAEFPGASTVVRPCPALDRSAGACDHDGSPRVGGEGRDTKARAVSIGGAADGRPQDGPAPDRRQGMWARATAYRSARRNLDTIGIVRAAFRTNRTQRVRVCSRRVWTLR